MSDKLDGSFSGLWTCELCGKTGDACTCEHYQRGGNVWGNHGTIFSEAELAAEYLRMSLAFYRTGRDDFREQAETIRRIAEQPSYEDADENTTEE